MTITSDAVTLNKKQKSERDVTICTIKPIADPANLMTLVLQSTGEREAVYKALAK